MPRLPNVPRPTWTQEGWGQAMHCRHMERYSSYASTGMAKTPRSLHSRKAQAIMSVSFGTYRVYAFLIAAIIAEVIATTALARSDGFTRLVPSLVSTLCYAAAFWLLSLPLRVMPTGIVYALWSGLGIVLIAAVAWIWNRQALDVAAIFGLALILAGVAVINVFSTSINH